MKDTSKSAGSLLYRRRWSLYHLLLIRYCATDLEDVGRAWQSLPDFLIDHHEKVRRVYWVVPCQEVPATHKQARQAKGEAKAKAKQSIARKDGRKS